MSTGWVPMQADWWPVIAESLPKPWPREAMLQDLRWWADQERMGRPRRARTARPGARRGCMPLRRTDEPARCQRCGRREDDHVHVRHPFVRVYNPGPGHIPAGSLVEYIRPGKN